MNDLINNNEQVYPCYFNLTSSVDESIKDSICNELIDQFKYNDKTSFNAIKWFQNSLLTCLSSGELLSINPKTFQKESTNKNVRIDEGLKSLEISEDQLMVFLGDKKGRVHVYDSHFNFRDTIQQTNNEQPLKDMATNKMKIVTAYEDKDLHLIDVAKGKLERQLTGHGNEITCVEYHPTLSLLVSGSKDHSAKLWDPRQNEEVSNLLTHNNTINKTKFNRFNQFQILTCSKDQSIKLFDIRNTYREIQNWKETMEVQCIDWHPSYQNMFCSCNSEGTIGYRVIDQSQTLARVERNLKGQVFDIMWNYEGDLVVTMSNDKKLDFYARNGLKKYNFQLESNVIDEPVLLR